MPSSRREAANRRNAKASTGPRTQAGKAKSSQNARTHGLAAAKIGSGFDAEVTHIMALLSSELPSDQVVADAIYAFAQAHDYLRRIRLLKMDMLMSGHVSEAENSDLNRGDSLERHDIIERIEKIERYERRAFSNRKSKARRVVEVAQLFKRL